MPNELITLLYRVAQAPAASFHSGLREIAPIGDLTSTIVERAMIAMKICRRASPTALRRGFASYASPSAQQIVAIDPDGVPVLVRESIARESHIAGESQRAKQEGGGCDGDLTGLRVWEAAPVLIRHLDKHRSLVQGKLVLELGSGTGAVGLACAAFGAQHSVLSDADTEATISTDFGWQTGSVLQSLRDNLALNSRRVQSTVSVAELRWGDEAQHAQLLKRHPSGFDVIVSSDTLYYKPEETYKEMASTIRALAAADCRVILTYMVRHGHEHTFIDDYLLGDGGVPGGRGALA